MSDVFDFADSAAATLAMLEPIMATESLEAAVVEAARGVGEGYGAVLAGVVVVLHGTVFLESWYPGTRHSGAPVASELRDVAVESATRGQTVPVRRREGQAAPFMRVLPLRNRLTGVLCVVPQETSPNRAELLDGVARLVGMRLSALVELDAERKRSAQLEHWFRVSDRQIRALELERQKFAALAGSIDSGVFVVDERRRIQWSSRWLQERFPLDAGRGWTGLTCQELCRRMGGVGGDECATCLVGRVFDSGQVVRCEFEYGPGACRHFLEGLPLRGPDGRPHQVMVRFGGSAEAEARAGNGHAA
jgi:hypothetical protein